MRRRRFLAGTGLAAAAGVTLLSGACSDDEEGSGRGAEGGPTGDVAVAEFAAGLEVLAVETYAALLEAGGAALGEVPPAIGELLGAAKAHHEAHLAAWNDVVTRAGRAAVTAPDPRLKPVVDAELGTAKTADDAADLARQLEETAAATYLSAAGTLQGTEAVKLAASIQAVDAKHAAVLSFVLGQYPVPDVFAKTDRAARPA
ncbi:MAG: ferritin-like domain-containing protein [Acidimicrobiales bacterium]